MAIRMAAAVTVCAALLWVAGCNWNGKPESDQQIQQQAKQATEKAKVEAQKAAAQARVAAAEAARQAHDVAVGVKAGLHSGKSPVDLNTASRAQLETLPGVTATTARRIEANRPYDTTHDLVKKGAVSEDEFGRIAGDVVVK
ncbi:MAG TPA: helix-hairpin-helix domain-containing protein [Acidobacteriaceae bacterium]|nr:helix-hairpin-helix domain-containing protein [Acidobacteriaceae bacterium]